MKVSEIKNSIVSLPGIGPGTAAHFSNLNIFTVGDLLQFYPRDYEDRTQKITLSQSLNHSKAHTIARVTGHEWFGWGNMKTLKILINDGTASAQLIAFNRPFLEKSLPAGAIIAVTGRFETKYNVLQSTAFEAEKIADDGNLEDYLSAPVPDSRIVPVYPLTEGLTQKIMQKAVKAAMSQFAMGIEDEIPEDIIEKHNLLHKKQAIQIMHNPASMAEYNAARNTLVFEELYNFQKAVARQSVEHRGKLPSLEAAKQKNVPVTDQQFLASLSPKQKMYLQRLTFKPTEDQKSVIFSMNMDIDKSYNQEQSSSIKNSMRSLLQGDVGSGKTLVSFFAALRIIDYGSQVALMAPTELLARQHADNAANQLQALGINIAFLTGNINAKGRLQLLNALKDGTINLVVGTHALFSKNVQYHDLALTIIDEQHRFGVMQRGAIIDKGRTSIKPKLSEPNLLMMSATPIPQTLALTAFGDLDILTIRTMPEGRLPVQTFLTKEGNEAKAYEAVRSQLKQGHQAYFVYPAIETNTSSRQKVKSAEEMFRFLQTQVYPEYKCALIHGKVDEEEQNKILSDFKSGLIQILVATTVVEVGVDVPNATCMVIEQADHFGLAALHQLRGRVGRGKSQSYCFLIYSANISETGIARIKAIRENTDGFIIAEEDLKLRGPGEITGTAQSGELAFALADLIRDQKIMTAARADAFSTILREYPEAKI